MFQKEHDEGSTVEYRATLMTRPEDGDPIPRAAILDLTLVNIYDGEECVDATHPPVLINGRQNIALITNGIVQPASGGLFCTMHATTGELVVTFPPACQMLRVPARHTERHIATLHLEHTTGSRNWEVCIKVRNLGGIA